MSVLALFFDLFCLFLGHNVYAIGLSETVPRSVEELIACDELFFEPPQRQLQMQVDCFVRNLQTVPDSNASVSLPGSGVFRMPAKNPRA